MLGTSRAFGLSIDDTARAYKVRLNNLKACTPFYGSQLSKLMYRAYFGTMCSISGRCLAKFDDHSLFMEHFPYRRFGDALYVSVGNHDVV